MSNDSLTWLPIPADFANDLRSAVQATPPAERLRRLASLAQHQLGLLETIQLDRALGQLSEEPVVGFSPVRLAMLASSTVDHLAPAIRVAGLRRGVRFDVHAGGFGQYRQSVLDPGSWLHEHAPQVVLFSLSARELLAEYR